MGVENQVLQDSRWRTIIKTNITGTNGTGLNILNDGTPGDGIETLLGWVTGSMTNLVSISWSVTTGIDLVWTGTGGQTIFSLIGSGRYGGSDGFPAIPNTSTGGAAQGNVTLANAASCKGYTVITYHKVLDSNGDGWSA